MIGSSQMYQAAVAILDMQSYRFDPGWNEVEDAVPGAVFYQYDCDWRTFEVSDDQRVTARGAILGSYHTEVMPGMPDDMSFTVPARFEIDVRRGTFRSVPQIDGSVSHFDEEVPPTVSSA